MGQACSLSIYHPFIGQLRTNSHHSPNSRTPSLTQQLTPTTFSSDNFQGATFSEDNFFFIWQFPKSNFSQRQFPRSNFFWGQFKRSNFFIKHCPRSDLFLIFNLLSPDNFQGATCSYILQLFLQLPSSKEILNWLTNFGFWGTSVRNKRRFDIAKYLMILGKYFVGASSNGSRMCLCSRNGNICL